MVRMRDGVRLNTAVYSPRGKGPFPVVLTRLPYDVTASDVFIAEVAPVVTAHGFVLVAQDCRGKARSGGNLRMWVNEVDDGVDTMDWLAERGWCNGSVFLWGDSYSAFTQWAIAASGHSALAAMAPRNTSSDVGGGWLHRQQVPRLLFPGLWSAHAAVDHSMYDVGMADMDWGLFAPRELHAHSLEGLASTEYPAWGQRPVDAWPQAVYGAADPLAVRVPVLHVGGWFDEFRHVQMREWKQARQLNPSLHYLEMRPTDHVDFVMGSPSSGDIWSERQRRVRDRPESFIEPQLTFFEWILGRRDQPYPPITITAAFSTEPASEPAHGPNTIFLRSDGSLGDQAGTINQGWLHDPAHPVPSTQPDEISWAAIPADDLAITERDDVLTFSGALSSAPWTIRGDLSLRVRIHTPGRRRTHIMAKLLDIAPDGSSLRIADGAAVVKSDGATVNLVDLGPTYYVVRSGHRLTLLLSSSEYPRYALQPIDWNDPWGEPDLSQVEHYLVGDNETAPAILITPSF
ncbi:MAG: peptidase [Frondihabitans sp.]|jgi:predicted acyl esterase|nr:peptidase [Frondihabitans sp.]